MWYVEGKIQETRRPDLGHVAAVMAPHHVHWALPPAFDFPWVSVNGNSLLAGWFVIVAHVQSRIASRPRERSSRPQKICI
jgi:hypothetical protein